MKKVFRETASGARTDRAQSWFDMLIRDIIVPMRHDDAAARQGKVELLTAASRAPAAGPVRRIVLLGGLYRRRADSPAVTEAFWFR